MRVLCAAEMSATAMETELQAVVLIVKASLAANARARALSACLSQHLCVHSVRCAEFLPW